MGAMDAGVVAFRIGHRGLALAGGIATAIAVALRLARSFSSLPAAVATALLGAALLPNRPQAPELGVSRKR